LARDGAKGESGLNSAVFGIDNASSTFNKNAAKILSPATGIVLTTSYQNITGTITYQWQKNSTNINGATSSSYTVPTTDYASVTTNAYKCIITGTINGTASSLNDTITIPLLVDGSSSPVVVLSNDNITVPAPNTGYAGINFSSAGCSVQAYIGTNALTYSATGGANTFKVTLATTGVTVAANTNASIPAPTAMSADVAYTDVTVTIYDSSNTALTPIVQRITYSVSRTGNTGSAGDAVDIIFIRSASQPSVPTASTSTPTNWYSDVASVPASANALWSSVGIKPVGTTTYTWDTPSRIEGASVAEVTVYTRGVPTTTPTGGSYTFGAANPLTTVPTSIGATWSASIPTGTAAVYTSRAVVNTAAGNTSAVAITGWSIPVISLQNGVDATFADLLSESDITAADTEGKNYVLPPSNSLKLYSGGAIISTGVVYSGGGTKNGLTATIDTNTGVITWTGGLWTTDTESFTFTARYNSVDYSAIYTYAKSKKGSPSVVMDLKSETDAVSASSSGAVSTLPSGNQAMLYEGGVLVPTNKITFSGGAAKNGLTLAINSSGNITLTQTTWSSDSETFTITATYNSVTYTSLYSIVKTKSGVNGASAIFVDLLSESDTVPADSLGANYSLPTGNALQLYIGGVVQTSNVTYTVTGAQSGLTATISSTGAISFSGTWTSDFAQFTFTANYLSVPYSAIYTISKARKGINTVLVDIKSDADVVSATSSGSVATLPSGNAIVVYEAGAVVTTGITYSGGVTKSGLTLAIDSLGNISLNQSSGPWSSDAESFTITTTYKSVSYTNIYSIAKAKAGSEGKSTFAAKIYSQTNSTAPTGGSYNFSNKTLTAPTGWSATQPASSTSATYACDFIFEATNSTATITATTWSVPYIFTKNGIDGNPGGTGASGTSVYTATVYAQQASTPSAPTGGSYNFSNSTLTAPSGWTITQPASSTTPTWSCNYLFSTTTPATAVSGGTWANLKIAAQNGANGVGTQGPAGVSATRAFTVKNIGTTPTISAYTTTNSVQTLPSSTDSTWYAATQTVGSGQAQWQTDGLVGATTTTWGTPYLTVFKADTLEAFTTKTGNLFATGDIVLNTNNKAVKSSGTTFGGSGFYLGLNASGQGIFSVGSPTTGISWNGSAFTIVGPVIQTSNFTTTTANAITNSKVTWTDVKGNAVTGLPEDGANKVTTYRQTSAPTGKANDIWIDTTNAAYPVTKTWTGSAWEVATGFTSTEGTKLTGIQAGATVGATWGTNITNVDTPYINALAVTEVSKFEKNLGVTLPANSSGAQSSTQYYSSLAIPSVAVSTTRIVLVTVQLSHSDSTAGYFRLNIGGLTFVSDVSTRQTDGSNVTTYSFMGSKSIAASVTDFGTVSLELINGTTGNYWNAGSVIAKIIITILTGKK
jgi:hypothetical protein